MTQDWTSFTLKIGVNASLREVYDAWTKSAEIEKWFLKTCNYSNCQRDENVQSGSVYDWTWYMYSVTESGRIVQANGKDFFQFSFAGECLVDIQLKEVGEAVLVTLTQHNIPTDEQSKFNIRIGCMEGWTFYLANLKSVIENGYDLRNKSDIRLKGINN